VRAYQLLFLGEEGRKLNPFGLVAALVIHHALGLATAVPMNIYYQHSPIYHEVRGVAWCGVCFVMQ
jgi:hypothetical protein